MLGAARSFTFDTGLDGESDTGDFAAAGNFGQLAWLFTLVGGDEEDDGVAAVFGPLRFGKRNAESGPGHGEGGEFLFDALFELKRGLFANGGQIRGGGLVFNGELFAAGLNGGAEFGGGFDGPHFGLNGGEKAEDLVNRPAVFALQLVDGGEAGFDGFQTGGVGFEVAQIVAKRAARLFELIYLFPLLR